MGQVPESLEKYADVAPEKVSVPVDTEKQQNTPTPADAPEKKE
jgi:hypothetical protein